HALRRRGPRRRPGNFSHPFAIPRVSRWQAYRVAARSGASRAHASPPRRPAGQGSKIILPRGNSRRRPSVVLTAPGGVPPAPHPSPIRRQTLAPLAPGSSFMGSHRTDSERHDAPLAIESAGPLPMRRWRGRRVGGSLYSSLFGTKPGAVSVHLPIASRGDLKHPLVRYARPTTRLSRCTISARPPNPTI